MPPTLHANLGASKAERWMNCPGSVALEAQLPDTTSVYAEEGTAAHALGEKCLRKGVDADVFVGTEIHGVMVTQEMADAVQVYVDYVREERKRGQHWLERRFDLASLRPPGPMFGTADCIVWRGEDRHLHVIDYKHGAGVVVDPTENAQLRYYALGAVVTLRRRPDTITTTIVQPRAFHPSGIIRSDTFSWDELVEFKKELFAAAQKTQEPDAPLVVGEWCRFCKAAATCPAQMRNAIEVAQTEFAAVPAEPTLPHPALLEQDQVLAVLEKAPYVEAWFNAVREHVRASLAAGEVVPGWKLVPKRATRKWQDELLAVRVLEDLGLTEEQYAVKRLVSPAQAEKKLKVLGAKLPEHLVVKESSGSNLVPESDSRQALPPAAADDFADA